MGYKKVWVMLAVISLLYGGAQAQYDTDETPLYTEQRAAISIAKENDAVAADLVQRADDYATQTEQYIFQQAYTQALESAMKEIQLAPRRSGAYLRRGIIYVHLKRYDEAVSDYTRALNLKPTDTFILFNRGTAYLLAGKYEQAIADFTAFLQTNPTGENRWETLRKRSQAYTKLGRYDAAFADVQQWKREFPDNYQAYYEEGNIYEAQGKMQEANARYRKGIILLMEEKHLYGVAAEMLLADEEDYEGAVTMFTKQIERLEEKYRDSTTDSATVAFAMLYSERGVAYMKGGHLPEAVRDFTKSLDTMESSIAYNNRGEAYRQLDDYPKAKEDLAKALILLEPQNKELVSAVYDSLGMLAWDTGEYEKAVTDFTKSLAAKPHAHTYEYRGKAYEKLGEPEKAKADAAEATRLQQEEEAWKNSSISVSDAINTAFRAARRDATWH